MFNLNDIFEELVEEQFIYDEDENGHNMSYGEYFAVAQYFRDSLKDYISDIYHSICGGGIDTICRMIEEYNEQILNQDDDTVVFSMLNPEIYLIEYDYDEEQDELKIYDEENVVDFMKEIIEEERH